MVSFCKNILQMAGVTGSMLSDESETCRSDVVLLLFSFKGEDFSHIIENHPFNNILVYGKTPVYRNNLRCYEDPEEIVEDLRKMNSRKSSRVKQMPTVVSSREHNSKRRYNKVCCPFCNREIVKLDIALSKHLTACSEYQSRPAVYGRLRTIRQPNGKSRGSVLMVYLPVPLRMDGYGYIQQGLHVFTNGRFIKLLNAVLRDTFRYVLERDDDK